MSSYFEEDYAEADYSGDDVMAITPLPPMPDRGQIPAVYIERWNTLLAALPNLALEIDAVVLAMSNNATNANSATSLTIGLGSHSLVVEAGKSYVIGQTIKAAATTSPTNWMLGDVTSYNSGTGELDIEVNAVQGSGTYTAWTLSLAAPGSSLNGSLTQDFDVKSLKHAIGGNIASASTIDLSAATGNLLHVTGNTGISAATMTQGKDVWVIFDGTPVLTYHATNHRLNSGGANVTAGAGDIGLYTYDGTTVRVALFKANGKAVVETAPPAGAPVGSGLVHFGSTPPANYLAVPSAPTNLSRATYATLFAAIGTTWGIGDNVSTFGMPWIPAGYAMIQHSGSIGSSSVGAVIAHTHTMPLGTADATGSPWIADGDGPLSAQVSTTNSTGGAANYAAGTRILICVKYQ